MDEKTFIKIVQIIRSNQNLTSFFKKLAAEEPLEKNLKMTEIITGLQKQKIPPDIIDSFKLLRKKEVLLKLKEIL